MNHLHISFRFATPSVIRCYVTLAVDYSTNTPYTNHCIVKMLHRVATECKLDGMLMQLRLFRVFQKVLTDPVAKTGQYDVRSFSIDRF